MFPIAYRGRAMSLAIAVNWGSNLAVSLSFLSFVNAVGTLSGFLFYLVIGGLALAFCYYFVPGENYRESGQTFLKKSN